MNKQIVNFLSTVQNIRPADVVDILIITLFIYLILVWFKKSRARLMLVGMVVLGSVYIMARVFSLYLTTMLFQAFFAIFLIMIVVIFQEDIRHFFERVAIWSMQRRTRRRVVSDRTINSIASAVANLARKRTGALMVVRGKDPLDRFLEAGIRIDALLNQALLESIFEPHTSTHDGAVIIEEDYLRRFGCHLPLSTNLQQISHFGTRHAAALGLAERADALCIVVSEERGSVSVAESGQIRELAEVSYLEEILKEFYRKKFPHKKRTFLQAAFSVNLLEKLIAVILACTMWLVFGHRTEIIRRDLVIPVEYRSLSSDKIIGEPKQREVTVSLSGSERAFDLLQPKELKVSLDMSTLAEGEHNFLVNNELVKLPAGLSIVNSEPDEIRLSLYKLVPITVPIIVKTEGRLPANVTLKTEPLEAALIVPSAMAKEIANVTTESVDAKSLEAGKVVTLKLQLPTGARMATGKTSEVKITVIDAEKKD